MKLLLHYQISTVAQDDLVLIGPMGRNIQEKLNWDTAICTRKNEFKTLARKLTILFPSQDVKCKENLRDLVFL